MEENNFEYTSAQNAQETNARQDTVPPEKGARQPQQQNPSSNGTQQPQARPYGQYGGYYAAGRQPYNGNYAPTQYNYPTQGYTGYRNYGGNYYGSPYPQQGNGNAPRPVNPYGYVQTNPNGYTQVGTTPQPVNSVYAYNNQAYYLHLMKVSEAKKKVAYLGKMAGLGLLLFLAFNILFSLSLLIPSLSELYRSSDIFVSVFSLAGSLIYMGIPFLIVKKIISKRFPDVDMLPLKKPNLKRSILCIPIGLTACILANIVTNIFINILSTYGVTLSQQSDSQNAPQTALTLAAALLATAVMPALMEEFAIRGVILQPARRFGMSFSIIATSVVFGIMHGNLIQAPFAFMVGTVFAFVAIKCDSLWVPIILHFLNNGFSVVISFLNGRLPEEKVNTIYYITIAVIIVLSIISVIILSVKDKEFFKKGDCDKRDDEFTILSGGQKARAFFLNVPMIIGIILMVLTTMQYVSISK